MLKAAFMAVVEGTRFRRVLIPDKTDALMHPVESFR